MHDSTTTRGPRPGSLIALSAVVLGCVLLQGSATVWSTTLLMLGCVLAFLVGRTARSMPAPSVAAATPQPLRLVGDGSGEDGVDAARAAMENAEASERAMQSTLEELDRVIESVGELCATIDDELEEQHRTDEPALRKLA